MKLAYACACIYRLDKNQQSRGAMYSQIYLDYVQDMKKGFFPSSRGHDCKRKTIYWFPLVLIILRKLSTDLIYYLNILKRLVVSVTAFTFVTPVYGLFLRVWMSWVKHLPEYHLPSISTPAGSGMILVTVACPVS